MGTIRITNVGTLQSQSWDKSEETLENSASIRRSCRPGRAYQDIVHGVVAVQRAVSRDQKKGRRD